MTVIVSSTHTNFTFKAKFTNISREKAESAADAGNTDQRYEPHFDSFKYCCSATY